MNREVFLTKLIEDTGMSQKAFTEKIGIPYATLRSMLKNGVGGAGVDLVMKICDGLGIKIDDLRKDKESFPQIEKMKLIKKMKHARIKRSFTREEVCEKLEIEMSLFNSWETGESQPDLEMFIKLCKLYHIDSLSEIIDDYPDETHLNELSPSEQLHIKNYRALDEHGKETVDSALIIQLKRINHINQECLENEQSENRKEDS